MKAHHIIAQVQAHAHTHAAVVVFVVGGVVATAEITIEPTTSTSSAVVTTRSYTIIISKSSPSGDDW